jgi:hypothetical protein
MFNASEFTGFDEAETFYNKSSLARHNFASVMSAILTLRRRSSLGCRSLSVSKGVGFDFLPGVQ